LQEIGRAGTHGGIGILSLLSSSCLTFLYCQVYLARLMFVAGMFILFAYLLKYTKKNTLVGALALPETLAVNLLTVFVNF
jgi:hypothetical protein